MWKCYIISHVIDIYMQMFALHLCLFYEDSVMLLKAINLPGRLVTYDGGLNMSNVIYVVPWAICDTDSIYINKVNSDTVAPPEKGAQVWDWCIRDVSSSPDKRSKDVYAIIDVYNGYKEKLNEKGMSFFSLNNSVDKLLEYGFVKATDSENEFIRNRVLKLGKQTGRTKKDKK